MGFVAILRECKTNIATLQLATAISYQGHCVSCTTLLNLTSDLAHPYKPLVLNALLLKAMGRVEKDCNPAITLVLLDKAARFRRNRSGR